MFYRNAVLTCVSLIVCCLISQPVFADDILWDQLTGVPGTNGYNVGTYTDNPSASDYAFDDFVVGGNGWEVTHIEVKMFRSANGHNRNSPVFVAFPNAPNVDSLNAATAFTGVETGQGFARHPLMFDFSTPVYLAPGIHYLSAWEVDDLIGYDQALWAFTTATVLNSQMIYQNPGGGEGVGTNPMPIQDFYGSNSNQAADLVFQIRGIAVAAPEPATLPLFVSSLLLLGCVVRKQRTRKQNH